MQEIVQFANNHPILCMAWIILLVISLVITFKEMFSKIRTINRFEAIQLINKKNAVIIDIRPRDAFSKGHISGARNILASDIKNGNFSELEKNKAHLIILVCATGNSAFDCAIKLSAAGFLQVNVLKDGIAGWIGENLPLVRNK